MLDGLRHGIIEGLQLTPGNGSALLVFVDGSFCYIDVEGLKTFTVIMGKHPEGNGIMYRVDGELAMTEFTEEPEPTIYVKVRTQAMNQSIEKIDNVGTSGKEPPTLEDTAPIIKEALSAPQTIHHRT